jgi:hypothetical protein
MAEQRIKVDARVVGRVKIRESDYLDFDRVDLAGEDFSGRKLVGFSAEASRFRECRFERLKVENAYFGAGMEKSEYVDCSFDRSRIRAPAPGRVRFVRCSFRDVRLREWFCWDADFIDCVFTGKAKKMIFNADSPEQRGHTVNEYRGNDFGGMDLVDCVFRGGVDLSKQVLPSGEDYVLLRDARNAIVRARAEVALWENDARREEGLALLRLFDGEADRGQEDLFLRPADYAAYDHPDTLRELFSILTKG